MKIFDWLNQITYDKQSWNSFTEEDKKSFEPYMIHRFLSMNPEYIEFVNLVQTFPYTDKEKIYNIYLYMIPKKKMFLKEGFRLRSERPKNDHCVDVVLIPLYNFFKSCLAKSTVSASLFTVRNSQAGFVLILR